MGKSYNPPVIIDFDAIHVARNAGAHNSFYRGKNLGTSVSAAQQAEITNGTFEDLFIGDYWQINSHTWRIAAFDYFWNNGDGDGSIPYCTTHHIVLVPDQSLGNAQYQTTNVTTGGYVNSLIFKNDFAVLTSTYNAVFNTDFGQNHHLARRELLTNADAGNGWAWTSVVGGNLMNENMVYGGQVWGVKGYDVGNRKTILPLFALAPDLICTRFNWWLSSIASSAYFCNVANDGVASRANASYSRAVRPYFVYK